MEKKTNVLQELKLLLEEENMTPQNIIAIMVILAWCYTLVKVLEKIHILMLDFKRKGEKIC